MKSTYKTKEELIDELEEMRQRIAELEKAKIEQKRVEEALRESEEKYRTIFDNIYDQVVYLNKYGTITAANDREKIFGRKPEEIIGKNFTKLGYFNVKDIPKMLNLFKDVITGRKKIDMLEMEIKHKNGHKILVEVSTRLIKKGGRIDGFLCMVRDITERKKAEETLKESEEKYRLLIENSGSLIIYFNMEGKVILMNKYASAALGWETNEYIGRSIYNMFPKKADDFYMQRFAGIIKEDKGAIFEDWIEIPGGKRCYLSNIQPVRDKNGNALGVQIISNDITDNKRAEEALQKAHDELEQRVNERTAELVKANMQLKKEIDMRKSKEKALSKAEKLKRETLKKITLQLAHEIKNPLSSIKSSAQLIEMDNSNKEKHKILRHMYIINKNVDICSRVIRDLYRFAHQPKLELKKVDISSIIKRIETYVLERIEKNKKAKVYLRIGKEIPKIFIDEFKLLQVLKNIINNSFDAISNHGVLTIHSEYINNCKEVLIEITDNGCGIKEKDIDHIFHPFFSSKSTGFGLGLPLSKDIIEAHKGKIEVESKEGKGTAVRIRLPAD